MGDSCRSPFSLLFHSLCLLIMMADDGKQISRSKLPGAEPRPMFGTER